MQYVVGIGVAGFIPVSGLEFISVTVESIGSRCDHDVANLGRRSSVDI